MTILNRLFICCALLLSGKTLAHDGTVYITGVVKGKTCIVSPGSEQLVVEMHDVAARQLAGQKNETPYEPFTINLEACGAGLSAVSTHFEGTPDGNNSDLLALTGGTDYATGVAIGLYNPDKSLIAMGDESLPFALSNDQTTLALHFYARYLAVTNAVTPGVANAAATFVLTYA
ncbi:fimbrial protein [Enterobacter hormaechei]|uniref:fimbrial protein n=1 Tax=Enterobacter hormaechei TaxID=158836 RepID=UPI000C794137|nr:fimbrial protein [Enterobacter hormaechei]MDA4741636.1 fimbrial protein [Enterobacter hormaechei]